MLSKVKMVCNYYDEKLFYSLYEEVLTLDCDKVTYSYKYFPGSVDDDTSTEIFPYTRNFSWKAEMTDWDQIVIGVLKMVEKKKQICLTYKPTGERIKITLYLDDKTSSAALFNLEFNEKFRVYIKEFLDGIIPSALPKPLFLK